MKKFTLFCAAVAAAMSMNAQETTPLTPDMWHKWTGFDAEATIIEDANPGVEFNIGKELGQGGMVIGQGNCDGDIYADLSEYGGIEGVATPGISIRLFFNRDGMQGAGKDFLNVDTDSEGKFSFKFSKLGDVAFVHLNFIKITEAWRGGKWPEGLDKCMVESMYLTPKSASEEPEPEVPVDPNAIAGAWFHQWDGYGADAKVITETVYVDDQIGKEFGGGATVLGTSTVAGDVYADLTAYAGIEAEGTPGVMLRLLFNRPTQDNGITECNPIFDADGKFTFMFTEVKADGNPASFIHLNAVKAPWGLPEGVTSAKITKFNVIPQGTSAVETIEKAAATVTYNIYGQRVDENYRGVVIKNGKKYIQK